MHSLTPTLYPIGEGGLKYRFITRCSQYRDSPEIACNGKPERIDLHILAPDTLLPVPPVRETTNRRLAWI